MVGPGKLSFTVIMVLFRHNLVKFVSFSCKSITVADRRHELIMRARESVLNSEMEIMPQ